MSPLMKRRLKVEALEHGQLAAIAAVFFGTGVGVDALFGRDRSALALAAVIAIAIGMVMVANTFLNLFLADLRERLYEAADGETPHS